MSLTTEIPLSVVDTFLARLPEPGTVDVTIEVMGEDIGDQIEVLRLPWHGMIHDAANRTIEVSVGGRGRSVPVTLRHEIHDPTHLWVEEVDGAVAAISIDQADQTRTLVRFHRHAALGGAPGPGAPPMRTDD